MTINKTDLANTSTFGTWKTRTNELLAFARKTVSLGDSGEDNNGNIVLNGNLSLGVSNPATDTITVNNISKCSTGDFKITNAATVQGVLTLDSGSGSASSVQFSNGGTPTWDISTQSDHSYLEIGDGASYIRFQADGSGGKEIDGEAITINNDILPDEITAVNFTSTGTGASRSVFAEANIGAGSITATTITCLGTGANKTTLSEVDINGGAIDGTAIGGATPSTAAFSTVSASGLITANGGVTGDVTGNVTGNASGTAGGLTDEALVEVLKAVYPIGSLFTSTANVDPGTARSPIFATGGLGFGTWERYAEGRTLVGKDGGSLTASAGHYSVRNAYLETYGAEYTCVFYFDEFDSENEVGLGPGDRVDLNVDDITLDSNNPLPWNKALGSNSGAGFEVLESGMSAVFTGVPYIRVDVSAMVNSNSAYTSVWPTVTNLIEIQVGGSNLTASNGFTIRNNRFRGTVSKGGMSHVKLDPKHIPDHVHTMESWESGIQYYGFNDNNSIPAPKAGFDAFGIHINTQYGTDMIDEHRQQGPASSDDGQVCSSTGVVKGYPGSAGIVDADVDKGHENMPPYEVVYIYRRIT